jgi:hypothetical protein
MELSMANTPPDDLAAALAVLRDELEDFRDDASRRLAAAVLLDLDFNLVKAIDLFIEHCGWPPEIEVKFGVVVGTLIEQRLRRLAPRMVADPQIAQQIERLLDQVDANAVLQAYFADRAGRA